MAKSSTTTPSELNGRATATAGVAGRKFMTAAAVVVAAIGVMVLVAMPQATKPTAAPTAAQPVPPAGTSQRAGLRSSEYQFDFGSISMAAGKVSHRYFLANTGNEPVVIRKLYTSCMCTAAEFVKGIRRFGPFGMQGHGDIPSINQSFEPGERGYVEVVFDPAAHGPAGVGPIERVVTIENSAGRPLELAFTAFVTP